MLKQKVALPVGAKERGTPRMRRCVGLCCAVSDATAAPRPPVVVASYGGSDDSPWSGRCLQDRSGIERLHEYDIEDACPIPSFRSESAARSARETIVPCRDEGDVVPVGQPEGPARLEGRAGG